MKPLYLFVACQLLTYPFLLQAQSNSNYIVNTPNADKPGANNTFLGYTAGSYTTTGFANTFIGSQAGQYSKEGAVNTFIGYQAGQGNQNGGTNTFIGARAGYLNTNGYGNVAIGNDAGYMNTGNFNIFLGGLSGSSNFQGNSNIFVGYNSGVNNYSGSANTFIGSSAGHENTTASFNTFFGINAGYSTTTGGSNFMMGTNAGRANVTGVGNFFLGDNTAGQNTTGSFNLYIGANAGNGYNVNGDNNLAIGFEAGKGNASGTNNTFIGFRADAGKDNITNATAVGNNAKVTASNSVVLGNNANVGIGNTAPSVRLHITTGIAGTSGLRLENLPVSSSATGGQSKFLTVDESGNVILGTAGSGGRVAAGEALWQRNNIGLLQSVQDDAVMIGRNLNNTPAGYKLFVEQGILTERVKVAVKNSSEWSDHVFAPGYKLPTLAVVEQHIQQTGHLPGVPSATEMVERGNDLHRTDAKLLEKIEELTLYSIEQQKRIDKLERMIEELSQKK
jgi:hypothetical protein